MNTTIVRRLLAGAAFLAIAGCGSATSGSGSGGATVNAASVGSAGTVLVDSSGKTLYSPMEEASGQLKCTTSDCTAVWIPLTVPSGTQPVAGSGVSATLATVTRPDGSVQVTAGGKPLYTFSLDSASGQANGNNVQDNFGGTSFTWVAITASGSGAASSGSPAATPSSSGGYAPGGY